MPLNIRTEGDLAILSHFGQLLNDPKHFDASLDLKELLEQGYRHVVLDLRGVREMGATSIGLLTTLTRLVRQQGGEVVLANANHGTKDFIEMMRMDAYWDLFDSLEEAKSFYRRVST
ncbi:anti-anti-sigma factor [Singulisphaera sp. GP187]|uniref:STAS domain-containing protein n=1 Tax=Singulisphaera sp. GP187 TaxID=1882752 RepID=UPI00092C39CF|nr:STAS domain-containing protein [Singulisphaera sp. GP187]SIO36173.1 anti-anti-sigma factor [Singulisphaera sp. GP187]